MQGYAAGFPVVLPTSVSKSRLNLLLTHLMDGNYLDALGSKTLTAELLLYNGDLRVLGYIKGTFDWKAHGQVEGEAKQQLQEHPSALLTPYGIFLVWDSIIICLLSYGISQHLKWRSQGLGITCPYRSPGCASHPCYPVTFRRWQHCASFTSGSPTMGPYHGVYGLDHRQGEVYDEGPENRAADHLQGKCIVWYMCQSITLSDSCFWVRLSQGTKAQSG